MLQLLPRFHRPRLDAVAPTSAASRGARPDLLPLLAEHLTHGSASLPSHLWLAERSMDSDTVVQFQGVRRPRPGRRRVRYGCPAAEITLDIEWESGSDTMRYRGRIGSRTARADGWTRAEVVRRSELGLGRATRAAPICPDGPGFSFELSRAERCDLVVRGADTVVLLPDLPNV
jgi:hypothetical protein